MKLWSVVRFELRDLFLSLVRLGIGHRSVPSFGFQVSSEVDWVQLKALADQHGLSAVVLDGLNEVSKSNSQLSTLNSNYRGLAR